MAIQLPDYATRLFEPKRYKVLYGGRGSGKSYAIADMLLILGKKQKIRVLCAREFQNSITESVHFLLKQEIDRLGFAKHYTVTNTSINGKNGSEFIFKGVRMNIDSIKSMAGITHVWLEEAHSISQVSWNILIPTIREPGSEIWVSFNPDKEDDPTYTMFVNPDGNPNPRKDATVINVNWQDNPWFPEVLAQEKDFLYSVNPDLAENVWGGKIRKNSAAQIFRNKWEVRAFEAKPEWYGPYFGADWGFSTDPSSLVKVYLDLDNMEVLVRNAKFGYHIEIDKLPAMFDEVPEVREFLIRADNARPETISYINRQRFSIEGAEKWSGSVEDGIEWLKSFKKIVIHPDCEQRFEKDGTSFSYGMITEAKNYSYKVDRLTQDVLTDVVDAYNHGWDAIRYALQPMIQSGNLGILDVL